MTDAPLVLVANSGDGTISAFRLASGRLEQIAVTDGLEGCSTFAIDPERDIVYAGVKGEPAGILTLSLDRESGRLTQTSRFDLPDGGMTYLALTHGGTGLLGASYGGGYGVSWSVSDGVIGQPASTIEFANLHSVLPSADGRFAYFVSLGEDLVAQYAVDDRMRLTALTPGTVPAPEGSGPRHLVLNRAEDAVYVLTEFSGEVLQFARDIATGILEFRGSATAVDKTQRLGHSVFGADPLEHRYIWGADLNLSADGEWLWCSERTASTLSALRVATDGSLTAPERFTVTEAQPRGFTLSPDGSWLIAAGERSTTISLYATDGDRLDLRHRAETGQKANWVRFV